MHWPGNGTFRSLCRGAVGIQWRTDHDGQLGVVDDVSDRLVPGEPRTNRSPPPNPQRWLTRHLLMGIWQSWKKFRELSNSRIRESHGI